MNLTVREVKDEATVLEKERRIYLQVGWYL